MVHLLNTILKHIKTSHNLQPEKKNSTKKKQQQQLHAARCSQVNTPLTTDHTTVLPLIVSTQASELDRYQESESRIPQTQSQTSRPSSSN